MPNVTLKRIDYPGQPSLWSASVQLEPDLRVERYGRSVAYALRKLADKVNELEQPQVIKEMRKSLKDEEEGANSNGIEE